MSTASRRKRRCPAERIRPEGLLDTASPPRSEAPDRSRTRRRRGAHEPRSRPIATGTRTGRPIRRRSCPGRRSPCRPPARNRRPPYSVLRASVSGRLGHGPGLYPATGGWPEHRGDGSRLRRPDTRLARWPSVYRPESANRPFRSEAAPAGTALVEAGDFALHSAAILHQKRNGFALVTMAVTIRGRS